MADYEQLSDKTIVRKAVGGDKGAFAELYRRFRMPLCAFVRARMRDSEACNDILEEAFIGAFRSLGRYRGEAPVYSWLCAIAKRKIADYLRSPENNAVSIERFKLENTATSGRVDDRLVVMDALGRLPQQYRQVLVLRYIEGHGVNEVAAKIGRSYKATESLLGRARKAFAKVFAEQGG